MIFNSLILSIFYIGFFLTYLYVREKGSLSIVDYFFILFNLQFGPHACFPMFFFPLIDFNVSVHASENAQKMYFYCMGLAYVGLAMGFYVGKMAITSKSRGEQYALRLIPIGYNNLIFLLICTLYIFIFIGLGAFGKLLNFSNFLFGNGSLSYQDIRYTALPSDGLAALTRFSITPFLFSVLLCIYIINRLDNRKSSKLNIFVAISLFLFCALQANKLGSVYYFAVSLLIFIGVRQHFLGGEKNRELRKIAYLAVATIVALLAMVYFQYSSYFTESGNDIAAFVGSLLVYRMFLSNSDGLMLFLDLYPAIRDHTYFSNVNLITSTLGIAYEDPSVEVAKYFFGTSFSSVDDSTTVQSGYIAFSYVSFGLFGVFVYSIFVGWLIMFLTKISLNFKSLLGRVVFTTLIGLNIYFLTSSPLHTALLSQGVGLIPFLFFATKWVKW